jgi:lipid-A-disaccharide synthase
MVNLLAGRAIVPELLQQDCTAETLSRVALTLLGDPNAAQAQREAFRGVLDSLRPPEGTPSEAAAREVLQVMDQTGRHRAAA